MKIITNQSQLKEILGTIIKAVPSSPTHPIMGNLLVETSGSTVSLTAFDLSISMTVAFESFVMVQGRTTIPARFLNDIVSRLPEGEITLTVEGVGGALETDFGSYKFQCMDAEDYPELPRIEAPAIVLDSEKLKQAIEFTLPSASQDESKGVLRGVNFRLENGYMDVASTDSRRLSHFQVGVEYEGERVEVTVPGTALEKLLKGLGEGAIQMKVDRCQVKFSREGFTLTTRTLEGTYPAYEQLIPRQFERQITVKRSLFLGSLDRMSLLAGKKDGNVRIDVGTGNITVSCAVQDKGAGRETLNAEVVGDEVAIGFNVAYLMGGLKVMNADEVIIHTNHPKQPVVIMPVGEVKQLYLVMPVQLKD